MNEPFEQRAAKAIGLKAANLIHHLRAYPLPMFYAGASVTLGVLCLGLLLFSPFLVAIVATRTVVDGFRRGRAAVQKAHAEPCACGHSAASHMWNNEEDNCAECDCRAFSEPV